MENYQRYSENWNTQRFLKGEDYPVAMAYVPWQRWGTLYDPEKGLECGTIFPDADNGNECTDQATDAKMGGYGQFLCSRGKSLS